MTTEGGKNVIRVIYITRIFSYGDIHSASPSIFTGFMKQKTYQNSVQSATYTHSHFPIHVVVWSRILHPSTTLFLPLYLCFCESPFLAPYSANWGICLQRPLQRGTNHSDTFQTAPLHQRRMELFSVHLFLLPSHGFQQCIPSHPTARTRILVGQFLYSMQVLLISLYTVQPCCVYFRTFFERSLARRCFATLPSA